MDAVETSAAQPRGKSGKKVLIVMLSIVVFAAIPAVLVPMLWTSGKPPKLVDMGVVPAFQLTDDRGLAFTEEALRGHPTVVSFIFTRCDLICPVTMMTMQHIQERTFDAPRVKLLSFSVDPTYDTPERLTAYAQKYQADADRWRLVTGPAATMQQLIEGPFMTSMQRDPDRPNGIPNIAHGGYFLLVDGELHIRGRYESSNAQELDEMIRAARYLARINK